MYRSYNNIHKFIMDNSNRCTPLPPIGMGSTDIGESVVDSGDLGENVHEKYSHKSDAEILAKVHSTLVQLADLRDLNRKGALECCTLLNVLGKVLQSRKKGVFSKKLLELNYMAIYKKILLNHFDQMMNTKNKDLQACLECLIYITFVYTDASQEFCLKFTEEGLNEIHMLYLNGDYFSDDVIINDDDMMNMCDRLLSAVYNVLHVHKVQAARDILRKEQLAVKICQKYRNSSLLMISFISLVIQAYLITEAENKDLNSEVSIFQFIITILEASLKGETFDGSVFSPDECIDAVNVLAVCDANKPKLIEAGVLKYYVNILQNVYEVSEGVIAMAAHGVWMLCFKCADEVKAFPGSIDALKKISKLDNEEIREKAEGALWYLENKENDKKIDTSKQRDRGHVFISYQRESMQIILKINDRLKKEGFKTWVDEQDMAGSVLESMAIAVEDASVVLICLSEKYKESSNCRTEAEYTFRKQKPIIPLRLQAKYNPDGWLGILVGSQLVFDVSVANRYNDSLNQLITNLQPYKAGCLSEDKTIAKKSSMQPSHEFSNPVRTWGNKEIDDWIEKNKLQHLKEWFSNFDGNMLLEYANMKVHAPDSFYQYCIHQKLTLQDALIISMALNDVL